MKYAIKKKETAKPKKDLAKGVVNDLSKLLVTAIKQNDQIAKIHAAQITRVVSDISKMNTKPTVVKPAKRVFHMDVKRGGDGYIKSVDGTIE